MKTCSTCGNALRQPDATFCPVCGTALKPDAPNAAVGKAWQARLRATQGSSSAWRLLWVLTGPLSVLLFPFHVRAAALRLSRHVRQRVAAPAFATARFKDASEGRQIVQRLAACGRSWAVVGSLAALLLALALLALLFLSPLTAPRHISYGNALGNILDGRGFFDRAYVYVNSPAEYEAAWRRYADLGPQVQVIVTVWQAGGTDPSQASFSTYPVWDEVSTDTPQVHRPYQYIQRHSRYGTSYSPVYRVGYLEVTTRYGTMPVGIVLGVGAGILYLSYVLLGVQFWRRFAAHTTAEAFAAAYARSDTAFLDKLLTGVKVRNGATIVLGIVMAVFPLQLLLFPFAVSVVFAEHESWEFKSGVADALGA